MFGVGANRIAARTAAWSVGSFSHQTAAPTDISGKLNKVI
jgi:hypothetical protein